jgi:hypothetical protein
MSVSGQLFCLAAVSRGSTISPQLNRTVVSLRTAQELGEEKNLLSVLAKWPDSGATFYGLECPGIESRWGRDFPHPSRPALGPTQPPDNGYQVSLWSKAAGAWRWPPTPSSAEVKERVQLNLYSPFGPSWPVVGWPLPFTGNKTTIPLTSDP